MIELTKPTISIGPFAYFRIYQKSLTDAFVNNYQHILMGYFVNNNEDLERVSMQAKFIKTTRNLKTNFRQRPSVWCFIN